MINFPDNPQVDDSFSSGDRSWKWNGAAWLALPSDITLAQVASSGVYSDLFNIPTTFPPETHSHTISEVDGLQAALNLNATGQAVSLYYVNTLPYDTVNGHNALVVDGSASNGPTMAYYFNSRWYRTLDNSQIALPAWTPSQISTVFWYDPSDALTVTTSGSTVTQVTDKSGNGYTLSVITAGRVGPTIGTRTLNGLNVFEYASTIPNNQILETNSFTYNQETTPLNIAIVLRCDNEAVSDQDFLFSGTETSNPRIFLRRNASDGLEMTAWNGSILTSNGVAPEDQNLLIIAKFNSTNSALRLNGTQIGAASIGTAAFTSLNIGGNYNEDQGVEGFIAEVVGFADNAEQERIEGYLAHKWGLVSSLPAGHAYKNAAP